MPLLALLLAAVAAPVDAPPLAPIGKWTVNYAENMCVLLHDFGDAAAPTSLAFRSFPLGTQSEVMIMTKGAGGLGYRGTAKVRFGDKDKPLKANYSEMSLPKDGVSVIWLRLEDVTPALADTNVLTIMLPHKTVRFGLPSTKPALAALRNCEDLMLRSWDIDPAELQRPLLAAAKGDPANGIGVKDYPKDAAKKKQSGIVQMLWTVGIDGLVHDCRILQSSDVPTLDKTSCALVTGRWRYKPALDMAGQPVATHVTRRVIWVAP